MSDNNGQATPRSFGICRASNIKSVESCSTQRELIAEACKRLALPEPTILEEPPSTSGKVPFARRPMGNYLLRTLRANDTLLAVRIDRLGRSLMDIFGTVQTLCDRNIRVFVIRGWGGQSIDLGRATDRLFLCILAWCAETERNLISERTRDGLNHRRMNGLCAGKRAFTYIQCYAADGEEIPSGDFSKMKGHHKRNLPDKIWLDQLCELLSLQRATGAKGQLLADYCRERGFRNRVGREWWKGTVHRNAYGNYMAQIPKALKLVRRMAVLGQLPEDYNLRVLAITGDTPASVKPKWKLKTPRGGLRPLPEDDRATWDAATWMAWWEQEGQAVQPVVSAGPESTKS